LRRRPLKVRFFRFFRFFRYYGIPSRSRRHTRRPGRADSNLIAGSGV
jgi:hypothetical protein